MRTATLAESVLSGDVSELCACQIVSACMTQGSSVDQAIEDATVDAVRRYRQAVADNRRGGRSPLIAKGLDRDIIRCYMRNITIEQIVEWLASNKQFEASKSAVGRICSRLFRMGIVPTGSVDDVAAQYRERL